MLDVPVSYGNDATARSSELCETHAAARASGSGEGTPRRRSGTRETRPYRDPCSGTLWPVP